MKIAIISDIHANEEALDAVVADMKNKAVDSIVCLWDIVTLGPSPREVLVKIQSLPTLSLYYRKSWRGLILSRKRLQIMGSKKI